MRVMRIFSFVPFCGHSRSCRRPFLPPSSSSPLRLISSSRYSCSSSQVVMMTTSSNVVASSSIPSSSSSSSSASSSASFSFSSSSASFAPSSASSASASSSASSSSSSSSASFVPSSAPSSCSSSELHSLPKTTSPLLDTFNRFHNYLRISITEKCNLRCVYCMPSEGVRLTPDPQLLSLEERKRLITLFAHHGVNKIRFTGGEPTINKTLSELIRHCQSLSTIQSIGITTNGLILKNQLNSLVQAGLTHVNISLDTLDPLKYEKISRRDRKGLAMILSSIYAAASIPNLSVKINCVLMRDVNYSEIGQFMEFSKESGVDVRFIEVMPFDDNQWNPNQLVSYYEAIDFLATQGYQLEKIRQKDPHDTTKWYQLKHSNPSNSSGRIGFITSMSSHFCGGCNRLRITADGKLKVCLFGREEFNLLDELRAGRSDEELSAYISNGVKQKKKALGGHDSPAAIAAAENRPMILIGG